MDRRGNSAHPSQSSPAGSICSEKQQTSIRRRRWVTDPYMYLTWAFPLNPLSGSANRLRQSRIDPNRSDGMLQSSRTASHRFSCFASTKPPFVISHNGPTADVQRKPLKLSFGGQSLPPPSGLGSAVALKAYRAGTPQAGKGPCASNSSLGFHSPYPLGGRAINSATSAVDSKRPNVKRKRCSSP